MFKRIYLKFIKYFVHIFKEEVSVLIIWLNAMDPRNALLPMTVSGMESGYLDR